MNTIQIIQEEGTQQTTRYTTYGPVRGSCRHQHRTLRAATRCVAADRASCRRQGGYSDRAESRVDAEGYRHPLTEAEAEWVLYGY